MPRTERQQRQEWEKIQGRFSDIIFGLSIEESVGMIASAIDGRKAEREDDLLIDESTKALSSGRLALNNNLPKSFSRSLPLHPFVAVMLCLISQQRFGQNERSLFSFLASNEPGSLQDYGKLTEKNISPYYTLDRLYDYLQINLGRGITAVDGLGQRWSDSEECVFRASRLVRRLRNEVKRLQSEENNDEHNIIIVSHGNFLSEVLKSILGTSNDVGYSCGNASVTKLTLMCSESSLDDIALSIEYIFAVAS